ncbi:hypothetical protein WICPIJ_008061 [Wickerhamomyces pijperi]|uniref:PUM-HD domain-containing protein n=1 Tax=Wickerhamomyces pijperi TaxID=599730 RepID=A0A9P8PYJ9_WICPI|nr:hypothetical protein WICPIJ_008061 [Wickerhamomyces pijperi]
MGSSQKTNKRSIAADAPANKKAKGSKGEVIKRDVSSESESSSEDSDSSSEDELDLSSSEDELDNQEEETEQPSNTDATESDTETADADGKKKETSKEQHAEQKRVLQERKLQRRSGTEIQHIKSLWERVRVKNPPVPKEIRDKLCDEIWKHSKDVLKDLVMKHDASRVVQTLVKFSSKERRNAIVESLKSNYYELATSSYGKYLLVKLLHYGSKESKELILGELHGKLRKLMRHKEGAYVVEDLFTLYSTAAQKKQMIREFWGSEYAVFKDSGKGQTIVEVCAESADKRQVISRNLFGTIKASVEKGSTGFQILHAAMREYVQIINADETREFIDLLHEQFAELIHTPEGCDVACTLIAKATAKERRLIVRSLKEHIIKLLKNEHGNIVAITLFLTVDDTVSLAKSFGNDVNEQFIGIVIDKYSRRPFLYLLNGLDPRYFSPSIIKDLNRYIELSKETSKKSLELRRTELLEKFSPVFYKNITENSSVILQENVGSQFISEVLMNTDLKDEEKRAEMIDAILEVIKSDDGALMEKPFTVRLLRSLIQGGKWDNTEKKLVKLEIPALGESFSTKFYETVIGGDSEKLAQWIENSNTSFIIVALYESFGDKKNKFFKDLKAVKKTVKESAKDTENKGAQLLLKLTAK